MAGKKSSKVTRKGPKTPPEVKGLVILAMFVVILISLVSFSQGHETHNLLGILGLSMGFLLHATFGLSSYILSGFLAWIGWRLLFNKPLNHLILKLMHVSLLVISTSMLLSVLEASNPDFAHSLALIFYPVLKARHWNYHLGGAPFYYLYKDLPYANLEQLLNWLGTTSIFVTVWLASALFLAKLSPWKTGIALKEKLSRLLLLLPKKSDAMQKEVVKEPSVDSDFMRYVKLRTPSKMHDEIAITPEAEPKVRPTISKKIKSAPLVASPANLEHSSEQTAHDCKDFKLPPPSLLTNAKKGDQSYLKSHLKRQAEVLEETLLSFGIEAKVGQINCGPTITSFEVHPSIGVKVQKIKAIENDIALNMEAHSIRIIAPIPGKAAVGIEVPNPQPQEVGFKDMLTAYQQGTQKFKIPLLLGKAVNGDYVMSDLTKWPHCLIAGATGSGKSVCINTIVMSILHNARPDEIKLLMIDPKKVELTSYGSLPHMLAPVITEPRDACSALNWLVREMEKRYEILKVTGTRHIEAFNSRTINQELEKALELEIPPKLPYIVGIIDELADLMMVASNDIETPIARIAQMARAVGIHLILATQRPSREVITGLIKANFPTRISFKVASRVNSQIILDEVGAEALLGNGDMLFLPPGTSHLIRAQGAYIRDDDIATVIAFITKQMPTQYMIQSFKPSALQFEDQPEADDPLYQQALEIVLTTGNASTTFLQRKLKLGYAKAASIMDKLEARGIVGPAEGAKPRKILVGRANANKQDEPDLLDGEDN